jgi:hypothetical protein
MKFKKIIGIIAIIIITVIVNFSIFLIYLNPKNTNLVFSQKRNVKIDKNFKYDEISVETLVNKYTENEEYGNHVYKDKIYTVYGKINYIESDENYITINLYSDKYLYINVSCNIFKKDIKKKDNIIKLKQNDNIKITGIIKGKFYDIIVDNCIIRE